MVSGCLACRETFDILEDLTIEVFNFKEMRHILRRQNKYMKN